MYDSCEPESEEGSVEEAEVHDDPGQPIMLLCTYCMTDNDEVKLRAMQNNRCWNCGSLVDQLVRFNRDVVAVSTPDREPMATTVWQKSMLAAALIGLIALIWTLVALYHSPY